MSQNSLGHIALRLFVSALLVPSPSCVPWSKASWWETMKYSVSNITVLTGRLLGLLVAVLGTTSLECGIVDVVCGMVRPHTAVWR